jgi:hypothetical protein
MALTAVLYPLLSYKTKPNTDHYTLLYYQKCFFSTRNNSVCIRFEVNSVVNILKLVFWVVMQHELTVHMLLQPRTTTLIVLCILWDRYLAMHIRAAPPVYKYL